jgi:hypothetical protein
MKAEVVLKFNNKVHLLLENGKVIKFTADQNKALFNILRHGDTGTLTKTPQGKDKFIFDSDDAVLPPTNYPATIQTPTT